MDITKSSRHSAIIGRLGEYLICNWLSRCGFEVTLADHTGLDIIAYDPRAGSRLGITVKSRTRNIGKERDTVNVFSHRKHTNDRQKLLDACTAFGCEPWIAVYVETTDSADVYLTSLVHYDSEYRGRDGKTIDDWKMSSEYQRRYERDAEVRHIRIEFSARNWWGRQESRDRLPKGSQQGTGV
jgi:hypothetical protein